MGKARKDKEKEKKKREPRKVLTPGSYKSVDGSRRRSSEGSAKKSSDRGKKRSISGEGSAKKNKNRKRKGTARKGNYKSTYSEENMVLAVKLVQESGYSISKAARVCQVKRTTLNDRLLKYNDPQNAPKVGRPQELAPAEEEELVQCLSLCAEFQYPMRKRDVQKLVQEYVLANDVNVRWDEGKPGKDWVRNFTKRWAHRVKVKRPTNIKRSRGKVSPEILRKFFSYLAPNVEGVPATHFFNYDETNLKDDPGKLYLPTYLLNHLISYRWYLLYTLFCKGTYLW